MSIYSLKFTELHLFCRLQSSVHFADNILNQNYPVYADFLNASSFFFSRCVMFVITIAQMIYCTTSSGYIQMTPVFKSINNMNQTLAFSLCFDHSQSEPARSR